MVDYVVSKAYQNTQSIHRYAWLVRKIYFCLGIFWAAETQLGQTSGQIQPCCSTYLVLLRLLMWAHMRQQLATPCANERWHTLSSEVLESAKFVVLRVTINTKGYEHFLSSRLYAIRAVNWYIQYLAQLSWPCFSQAMTAVVSELKIPWNFFPYGFILFISYSSFLLSSIVVLFSCIWALSSYSK